MVTWIQWILWLAVLLNECHYHISDALPTPKPENQSGGHMNTKPLVIGCSVGGIALLGFVAFLIYIKKFRNMNVACKCKQICELVLLKPLYYKSQCIIPKLIELFNWNKKKILTNLGVYIYNAFEIQKWTGNCKLFDINWFQANTGLFFFTRSLTRYTHVNTHKAMTGCACMQLSGIRHLHTACILYTCVDVCVYMCVCMLHFSQYLIIFFINVFK